MVSAMKAFCAAALVALAGCGGSPPRVVDAPLLPEVDASKRAAPVAATTSGTSSDAPAPTKDIPLDAVMRTALVDASARLGTQDAALFQRAHERLYAHDLDAARKLFFELITKEPQSPLVPYAYVAFADLFFDEAEAGDKAKHAFAKQAYEKVVSYPPPANEAYAYALHRRGVVHLRLSEYPQALDAQRKAIMALAQHRTLPVREAVLEGARRELVTAYGVAGAPDKALPFFKSTDPDAAMALLLALGEEYVRRSAVPEAIALYATALRSAKGEPLCNAARAAYASLGAHNGDPALARQLTLAETQRQTACTP